MVSFQDIMSNKTLNIEAKCIQPLLKVTIVKILSYKIPFVITFTTKCFLFFFSNPHTLDYITLPISVQQCSLPKHWHKCHKFVDACSKAHICGKWGRASWVSRYFLLSEEVCIRASLMDRVLVVFIVLVEWVSAAPISNCVPGHQLIIGNNLCMQWSVKYNIFPLK